MQLSATVSTCFCLFNDGTHENLYSKLKSFSGILCLAVIYLLLRQGPAAAEDQPKRTLKNSNEEVYNILPETADSLQDIFTKSMFYGRIRAHYFWFDRTDEPNSKTAEINGKTVQGVDPIGFAVGGSMIYKTAPFKGLSATLGYYVAQNLSVVDEEDIALGRSGKDTFSRNRNTDEEGHTRYDSRDMYVLAQSYLQFHFGKTDIRTGRQIFESYLTASNDSKMIPNTFLGTSIMNENIPDTTLKAGYFTQQKLRDHITFHDVMLVDGWLQNDDSGSHTRYTRANGGDTGNDLIVFGAANKSVPNLKLDFWYTGVPDLFYSTMYEANYTFKVNSDLFITPGFRYLRQYDDGLDDITLKGLSDSQIDALNEDGKISSQADTHLYAARIVTGYKSHKVTFGYHKNDDEGDVVAPWRGFPTGGYTRTMTEVNWSAGTESEMINWAWKINSSFRHSLSWAHNNRRGINTDTTIYQGDFWYTLNNSTEFKLRLMSHDGWGESDFNEARLEMNYLF